MTLEDLKKHVRPLVWREEDDAKNSFLPINCIDEKVFIFKNKSDT